MVYEGNGAGLQLPSSKDKPIMRKKDTSNSVYSNNGNSTNININIRHSDKVSLYLSAIDRLNKNKKEEEKSKIVMQIFVIFVILKKKDIL